MCLCSLLCVSVFFCTVGPTDCIVDGDVLKLGGPSFNLQWQKKYLKLYPNRLEFYQKSKEGLVARSKGVEVSWSQTILYTQTDNMVYRWSVEQQD